MNTEIEEKRSIKIIKHKITCDICGKELDTIEEGYDGYYENPYECKIKINPFSTWHYYNKDLCSNCFRKVKSDFLNYLKGFGFETK